MQYSIRDQRLDETSGQAREVIRSFNETMERVRVEMNSGGRSFKRYLQSTKHSPSDVACQLGKTSLRELWPPNLSAKEESGQRMEEFESIKRSKVKRTARMSEGEYPQHISSTLRTMLRKEVDILKTTLESKQNPGRLQHSYSNGGDQLWTMYFSKNKTSVHRNSQSCNIQECDSESKSSREEESEWSFDSHTQPCNRTTPSHHSDDSILLDNL